MSSIRIERVLAGKTTTPLDSLGEYRLLSNNSGQMLVFGIARVRYALQMKKATIYTLKQSKSEYELKS
jgi:hypothetical protein